MSRPGHNPRYDSGVDRLVAGYRAATLRDALAGHYLWQMICDHKAKTDVAVCSCGLWKSDPMPSVGEAARSWAAHALASIPTLPGQVSAPPEDERVKGLTEALRRSHMFFDVMLTSPFWAADIAPVRDQIEELRAIALSALASYRGGA